MQQGDFEFFARCAGGFEGVLAQELRGLGLRRVRPLKGGVAFFGSVRDGYACCLWSRVATRVQLVLARVRATDADALYRDVAALAWEHQVRRGATIAVVAHGTNARLRRTTFTAQKVKDAVCDRLRTTWGARPDVDAHRPDLAIGVSVHEQKATLSLDLAGESLHRRGYRADGEQTEAPLKETLAAGLLLAAGFDDLAREGANLVDPMCGSGTLAVEAALIAARKAPGLLRERWGFEGWAPHDDALWGELVADAWSREDPHVGKPRILAGDLSADALAIAKNNARRAGVDRMVQFVEDDAARLARHLRWMRNNPRGLLVANPPYGQRLLSRAELPQTYAALSCAVESVPASWDVALITPDAGIDSALGRLPYRTVPCFNGPLKASIRLYARADERTLLSVASLDGTNRRVPVADAHSAQFAARFRKMARERDRWAREQGVDCYRIYDADVPEYPFTVDAYEGVAQKVPCRRALVTPLRKPLRKDEERFARRRADVEALVAAVLGLATCDVVVAADDAEKGERMPFSVREGALAFDIDLSHPRDVLPLEELQARSLVRQRAKGADVVRLFAQGSATLAFAAEGGARSVCAVDASKSRLAQAREVLGANGLAHVRARFDMQDVRVWLDEESRAGRRYEIVACSPPTWLPAQLAGGRAWELERELAGLIAGIARILARGGMAIVCLPRHLEESLSGACGRCGLAARPLDEFGHSLRTYVLEGSARSRAFARLG